jgi:hypothetical protein
MSVRFLFLILYLSYALYSGSLQATATSCSDPLCKTPPPPASTDTGGGVDPNGRT